MPTPLVANKLLFPEVFWRLPGNLSQRRGRVLVVGGAPQNLKPLFDLIESAASWSLKDIYLALPESSAQTLREIDKTLPILTLPETSSGTIGQKATRRILELTEGTDILIAGESLTRQSETAQFIREIVREWSKTLFIFGEALEAVESADLTYRKGKKLLSADLGSLARLLKKDGFDFGPQRAIEYLFKKQEPLTQDLAFRWQTVLISTGPETVVGDPSGKIVIVPNISSDQLLDTQPILMGMTAALAANQPDYLFECAVTALYAFSLLNREKEDKKINLLTKIYDRLEDEAIKSAS
jgi:NAD(P)H-hydrate repair Nnr-like enzyme with NAD(P)H-hydrate dehydratase domain